MRQLLAVALVLTIIAIPAGAQHVGARGGSAGFRGGFSGRRVDVSHRGFFGSGQVRDAGGSRVQNIRPAERMVDPGLGIAGPRFVTSNISSARSAHYNRNREGRRYRKGSRIPYVLSPYAGEGWWDSDYPGYPDEGGYYNDDSENSSADESGTPEESYGDQQPAQYQHQQDLEEPSQQPAVAQAQAIAPTLYDSQAVTLVFKDGRPSEKIHNYALTRTTLYVTDMHHREIPVTDLDLAATEKANRDAGINFQLPHTEP